MKLELYIPGLLAAPARVASQLELPGAPALREWCEQSRDNSVSTGRYGFFCDALAMQHAPLAALAWLGATEVPAEHPVFFATPVHFEAGLHDLVLFAGRALEVTTGERVRLAHDIAAFFGDDPSLYFAGDCLFMQTPAGLDVETMPLHQVLGRGVRENLPRGKDAVRVHAWMNELQMFLHDHAINRERAARGLPSLSGLWFWGEGELPARAAKGSVTVFAESLPMRGLGVLLGEAREPLALEDMLPESGHSVIECTACTDALDADDVNGWQRAVEKISADLLQPVLDWLAVHRKAEAVLFAGDGKARTLRGRQGWWRRVLRRKSAIRVIEE